MTDPVSTERLEEMLRYRVENPSAWPEGFDQEASDLMRQAADALASRQAPEGVRVKPLQWRVPTDHPKDPDVENNDLCADGVGGIYAISNKQTIGPERLLWMADDPFVWKACGSIQEAKAAAQAHFNAAILSAIEPVTQTVSEELLQALQEVRAIIFEAALVGFNPMLGGDWAERLYASQSMTAKAVRKAGGNIHYRLDDRSAALKGASHDQP